MHEVAIIGGGLAGLALSISLKRKGFDVVLIEKNKYPFHKVCGEYISLESANYLKWLGADYDELGAKKISKFTLTHYEGHHLQSQLPLGGIGISRFLLDDQLAKQAKKEGVHVLDGVKVLEISNNSLVTTQGEIKAKLILSAHGKRSNIDTNLERPFINKTHRNSSAFIGVKYHIKAALPKDIIGLHIFPGGYAGLSAIEGDRYCFCYLSKQENLRKHGTIEAMETAVLTKNKFLADQLDQITHCYSKPEVISQINFENKEKQNAGVLFAGDAAGLVAPLSGNGMSMALHSAYLLSSRTEQYLKGKLSFDEMHTAYIKDWQNAFGKRFRTAYLLQSFFFNPIAMGLLIKTANLLPSLKSKIIAQTHGKTFFKE